MIDEIFNSEIQKAVHSCLTIDIDDEEGGIRYEGHLYTDQDIIYQEVEPEVIDAILKDKNFIEQLKAQEPDEKLWNDPYETLKVEIWDYLSGELGISAVYVFEIENGEE